MSFSGFPVERERNSFPSGPTLMRRPRASTLSPPMTYVRRRFTSVTSLKRLLSSFGPIQEYPYEVVNVASEVENIRDSHVGIGIASQK